MASNLVLRLTWIYKLSDGLRANALVVSFFALLEVFRWVLLSCLEEEGEPKGGAGTLTVWMSGRGISSCIATLWNTSQPCLGDVRSYHRVGEPQVPPCHRHMLRRFQWMFVRVEVELRKLQNQKPELGSLMGHDGSVALSSPKPGAATPTHPFHTHEPKL